ncbi:MAG: T9SS type A sorting domain-containing protein [Deferribacteres bacterium]|nr:T9SS type A sorting domain-containing protein [candidate division KSB1 bacterium]MCB9500525.1 T9SS type A sorting domain-containing protein [Deferribacteres bacterium]
MKNVTKWALVVLVFSLFFAAGLGAQTPSADYLYWEDNFSDTATDPDLWQNVGWFYYGPNDGLIGQEVRQVNDEAYILQGNYAGLVGAGLIETNGVAKLDTADEAATKELLVANNYSHPNQVIQCKLNIQKMKASSWFLIATRMEQTNPDESLPDSDPTEEAAYVLHLNPVTDLVQIAKYDDTPYNLLSTATFQDLATAQIDLELDVYYWIKFYLNEGDLKVKIWEGEATDEPDDWLLEATDSDPRVAGKYTMFAMMGVPPNTEDEKDIFRVDDITVSGFVPLTAVKAEDEVVPNEFALGNNYPNPFNPETTINFSLEKAEHVTLRVYNATGQLVRTLVNENMEAGQWKINFNGLDGYGRRLSSGVYFYQLQNATQQITKKMVLLK